MFKNSNKEQVFAFLATVNEIQTADQFIRDCPSYPGSTEKIIRSEMVSVIGATLSIEGTRLGAEEIVETFEKANHRNKLVRPEQEAENSRRVYKFIEELVRNQSGKFVYSEAMVKQIHQSFTEGLHYLGNAPGQYRGEYVTTFGEPRRKGLCRNNAEINEAMTKFVEWLNRDEKNILSANYIVKAIMAHYYLTEIHPFGDGNGRTARALEALILYANGINHYCFWSLANFWAMNRDMYIANLGQIRDTSNPWEFLIWGINGYLQEILRIKGLVLKKVKQLMYMDYVRWLWNNRKGENIKISERIVSLLGFLVRHEQIPLNKFYSRSEVSILYHGKSSTTRFRDLRKMQQTNLIRIVEEEGNKIVKPNFQILENLRYGI